MRVTRFLIALIGCVSIGLLAPVRSVAQDYPRPSGRGNKVLKVARYPFQTAYTQTRETFKDMRKDKLLLLEAIVIYGTQVFDTATTVHAMKNDPGAQEGNPVARLLVGARPHGARPWIVMMGMSTLILDCAHDASKGDQGFYKYATPMLIFAGGAVH